MISQNTAGELGGRVVDETDSPLTGLLHRGIQVIEELTTVVLVANGVEDTSKITTLPVGVYLFGQGITSLSFADGVAYLIRQDYGYALQE